MLMGTKNKKENIFSRMQQLSFEMMRQEPEIAKSYFEEFGIDYSKVQQGNAKMLKKIRFLAKVNNEKSPAQNLYETALNLLKGTLQSNAEASIDIIKEAFTRKQAAFQFRNFKDWSEKDLRDVLSEIEIVELMEKLEDDDNKKKS